MSSYQKSISRERAIALFASRWWEGRTSREIARLQLFTRELCLPFDHFHRAVEESLARPVMIHELGLNLDGIIHEFLGESDPPTLAEILDLLPAGKLTAAYQLSPD